MSRFCLAGYFSMFRVVLFPRPPGFSARHSTRPVVPPRPSAAAANATATAATATNATAATAAPVDLAPPRSNSNHPYYPPDHPLFSLARYYCSHQLPRQTGHTPKRRSRLST